MISLRALVVYAAMGEIVDTRMEFLRAWANSMAAFIAKSVDYNVGISVFPEKLNCVPYYPP